jgi:hypothetical protein
MAPNWIVRGDGSGRLRFAARPEIGRRGDHDPPHLADMPRDQRGIGEMADPHREIDAVFHQVDELIR